jgi:hypothetical protein
MQKMSSKETQEEPMERAPIYTTESGTQYIKPLDLIRSKKGWAEIKRIGEANLVRRPPSNNGEKILHIRITISD